jgi:thioredoxin 1
MQTSKNIVELNETNFEASVADGVTLVDFWAPWCGPCRMLAPVLDELADDLDGRASVAKINVDDQPSLAARFRVSGIPLLVVIKDGREVDRVVGLQNKVDLAQLLARHTG